MKAKAGGDCVNLRARRKRPAPSRVVVSYGAFQQSLVCAIELSRDGRGMVHGRQIYSPTRWAWFFSAGVDRPVLPTRAVLRANAAKPVRAQTRARRSPTGLCCLFVSGYARRLMCTGSSDVMEVHAKCKALFYDAVETLVYP